MKLISKIVGATLGLALAVGVSVGVAANRKVSRLDADNEVTDVINRASTQSEIGNTATNTWADFSISGSSGAAYAVHSMGTTGSETDALRWNANGWLVCTASAGTIKSITVTTSANKNVGIYAKNSAYSAAAPSGSTIATLAATSTGATYEFTTDYTFFALKGTASSTLITNITIVWTLNSKADVTLDCDDLALDITDPATQLDITATSGGNEVAGLTYTYEVEDTDVATVDEYGYVTPGEIGETELTISYAGNEDYNPASKTINVVVSDRTLSTSSLIFTGACGGSGTADDGASWTVASDGAESNFDSTSGIHYGTGSAYVTYLQLSTSDLHGNIKRVVVNARDAQTNATVSVTVGNTAFSCSGSASATNTSSDFVFTGNARGEIVVRVARDSSMLKALYVKSIIVTYSEITLSSISLSGDYQVSFEQGDVFNHDGMTVTAIYSDASEEDVTSEATFTGYDMAIAGEYEVTVSYGGKTAKYNITVTAAVMYTVGGEIENGSLSSTASVRQNTALNITINANHRYSRPTSLTVTMGGSPFDGFTYNSSTGAFNISSVTGNVVINGECGKMHGYWDTDPFTVAEALVAINALGQNETIENAYVEGIISRVGNYYSTYHSVSYWISDNGAATDELQIYSGKGLNGANFASASDIEVAASVMVSGTLVKYNNTTPQFNSGSQMESYTAPSAASKIEAFLNSASSVATISGEENKSSDAATETMTTANFGIADAQSAAGSFDGDNFTATFSDGCKYYDNGEAVRVYAGNSFTIASSEEISKIEFTWDGTNKPTANNVVNEGTYDKDTSTWTGSSHSVTFTRPSGSGNWRVKTITVSYGSFESIVDGSIKLRFGAKIPTATWDSINALENVEITGYGVALFRTTEALKDSAPSVQSLFNAEPDKANPVHVAINVRNSNIPPAAEDGYYTFVSRVNITKAANYNMYFCAQAFIVVNGEDYYFIDEEMRESVRTLAASNDGTNLSNEALASLLS